MKVSTRLPHFNKEEGKRAYKRLGCCMTPNPPYLERIEESGFRQEAFLANKYGDSYQEYRKKTPRYLGLPKKSQE